MNKTTKTISLLLVIALVFTFIPAVAAKTTDYAYVRIQGYDGTLIEKTTVELTPFDLDKYGVSDGADYYSALHGIVAALEKAGYDATDSAVIVHNGGSYVTSVLDRTAEDNAGWMYVLNDDSSWNSIKEQKLEKDDYIVLYYIQDWMTCSYSTFGFEDAASIDAFSTVKLNLKHQVTDPMTWAVTNENLEGATITIDGKPTDILTDSSGNAYVTFNNAGKYEISATMVIDDVNTISGPAYTVTVKDKGVNVKIHTKDKTYSAFVNPDTFDLSAYNVTSDYDFTALHAVIKGLEANGIDAKSDKLNNYNGGSYVSKLAGLEALGNSGWMYTVNNETSWFALNEQILEKGDLLDVYYIRDWMTDGYAFFDMDNISIEGGDSVRLRLYRHVTDMTTWMTSSEPYANVEITVNGKRVGLVTDASGYVDVKLYDKGVYELSVITRDANISRAVAVVNVVSDASADIDLFSDANDISAEYKQYVEKAVSDRVLIGDGNNRINAKTSVTKAEFLTMLIRASGLEVFGKYSKKYNDIAADSWFYGYAHTVFKYNLAKSDKGMLNAFEPVSFADVNHALKNAFDSKTELNPDINALFDTGLTREQAVYLIYTYKEAVKK